jgi:2'-5' RNA ligase
VPDKEPKHRIFFALWPDEATRQAIAKVVKPHLLDHPAKKVPQHNWHLTLAFLGNIAQSQYDCALAQAAQVQGESFELVFDTFGFWSRPQVVWLGCSTVPAPLQTLVEQLNMQLVPCAYKPEHRPYAPHLTLLRKASHGMKQKDVEPVRWRVNNFVLVESVTDRKGSIYQVVQHWPLH